MGSQYRSGIYTHGPDQALAAERSRDAYQGALTSRGARARSPPRSRRPVHSFLPRTTTSNTSKRIRTVTAASAARASSARSESVSTRDAGAELDGVCRALARRSPWSCSGAIPTSIRWAARSSPLPPTRASRSRPARSPTRRLIGSERGRPQGALQFRQALARIWANLHPLARPGRNRDRGTARRRSCLDRRV